MCDYVKLCVAWTLSFPDHKQFSRFFVSNTWELRKECWAVQSPAIKIRFEEKEKNNPRNQFHLLRERMDTVRDQYFGSRGSGRGESCPLVDARRMSCRIMVSHDADSYADGGVMTSGVLANLSVSGAVVSSAVVSGRRNDHSNSRLLPHVVDAGSGFRWRNPDVGVQFEEAVARRAIDISPPN